MGLAERKLRVSGPWYEGRRPPPFFRFLRPSVLPDMEALEEALRGLPDPLATPGGVGGALGLTASDVPSCRPRTQATEPDD